MKNYGDIVTYHKNHTNAGTYHIKLDSSNRVHETKIIANLALNLFASLKWKYLACSYKEHVN